MDNRTGGQGGDPLSIILDGSEEHARRVVDEIREQSGAVKRAATDAKTSALEAKLKALEAKQEMDRKYDSLREETRRDVERAKALAEETKAAAHKAEMALSAAKMASGLANGVGNAISGAAGQLSKLGPGDLPAPRSPAVQQASIQRRPQIPLWRRQQAELDQFTAQMGNQLQHDIQQYSQGVQYRHNAAMRGVMP